MNEEHIFIVRCGEVALKGMNKPYFERMLAERIRKLLKKFDGVSVYRHEGLIFVRADRNLDKQAIIREISKVFGVASISPAMECESTMEDIGQAAVEYMMEAIQERGVKTFKVGYVLKNLDKLHERGVDGKSDPALLTSAGGSVRRY